MRRSTPPRHRRTLALITVLALPLAGLLGLSVAEGTASATVPPAPSGWTTVFSDDFNGPADSSLNTSDWLYDTGTSYPGGAGNWGTGEVETETNSTSNVYEDGSGHLVVKPIRDANGNWTSGRVETQRSDFAAPAGGELELSASIEQPDPADGLGYWPAFWALGAAARPVGATNWPSIGELDIMEDVNALSEHSSTFHCGVDPGGPCNETTGIGSGLLPCSGCQTGYHTYSVILDRTNTAAEQLRYYLDGNLDFTVNESQVPVATWQAAVDHGFFAIFNVAVGGAYPDAICGCTSPTSATSSGAGMSVDWFAVYENAGSGSTPTPTPTPTAGPTPTPTPTPTATPTPTPTPTSTGGSGGGTQCTTTAVSDISADCYGSSQGAVTVSAAGGDTSPSGVDGNQVAQLSNGSWLEYPGVNFGSGSSQFDARVASGAAGGVSGLVNVVLDSPSNAPIGSFAVGNTGGWSSWETVPANIAETTGTHNVYLEFASQAAGNPPYVSLHYFNFPAQ
ncbi:carbohydrate-binding protein [Streptacidiphilus sp. P02-A3a]|uniref:carbohydrate-binding protein n=1 Tax=Streptacidiphilus sp. P02-A3a TaxID=2704468 RepID=UPI0015F8A19C|nr:carbohydrate-binding protein [Streptacidiphilus sp. P02-A3a]QMU70915.1 carbohydrate-binding protein [Streptacidiphilus sp. P02-A3a]